MRQRPPGTIEYNPFLPDARDTISTYDPAHWLNESEEDALKERIAQILAHYPDKDNDKEPDSNESIQRNNEG